MLVHLKVTPMIKVAGTHLATWVPKNTRPMSQARDGTQSALSGVEFTNHEASAPPYKKKKKKEIELLK